MEQVLEIVIIMGIIAIALAFLAKRYLPRGKQSDAGCHGSARCRCSKPELPRHFKRAE